MSIQHHYKTPPESFTSPPLTPPPTDEPPTSEHERCGLSVQPILKEIKSRKAGTHASINPWSQYILEPEGYKDLLQRLQSDSDKSLWGFVKHKLRYDYFPSSHRFILRMPTQIHESIIKSIAFELERQLRSISGGKGLSAEFAKEIESEGSASIESEDSRFRTHDPDGQFRHSEANYPGVVLEIAYSQKAKALPVLADEYILGSDGDIRVVIGISLDYKENNKATISVWEPRIVPNGIGEDELVAVQTVTDQSFWDEHGNPNASASINLQLQQFAPESFGKTHGVPKDPIVISAEVLCESFENAMKRATRKKEGKEKGAGNGPIKPWVRKRPRERTPEEKLADRHEKRFREDEGRVEEKMEADDSSYKTGSSFGTE